MLLPQGPVRIVFRIPQPPSPPGRGRTGPRVFRGAPRCSEQSLVRVSAELSSPKTIRPACRRPFCLLLLSAAVRLLQRRVRRAENDARLVVRALLHHDGGGIDAVASELRDGNGPRR